MNTFTCYMPDWIDAKRPRSFSFNSIDELFDHEWVKQFSASPDFYQFELAHDNLLMATYRSGSTWLVVGKADDFISGLPMWKYPPYENA